MNELTEEELMTLEALVTNTREWALLRKLFRSQIDMFWDTLRLTDPADETRVAANHKLAVGVESSLGHLVATMEAVVAERQLRSKEPEVIEDSTKELYGN